MSWIDLVVIGILVGFAIIGLKRGFIFSLFKIVSFFIAAFIAIKFYPIVQNVLMKTALFTNIKNSIYTNLLRQELESPKVNGEVKKVAADTVINQLKLPEFLRDTIVEKMPNPTKLIDVHTAAEQVSYELAKIVIAIISVVLLYILVRIGLIFVRFLLQGIAKLPLFKQMDKFGGLAFGAVEGLLTVYILCAVVMLFRAMPQFKGIFEAIDNSSIANYFYQHNFIIEFMFPK